MKTFDSPYSTDQVTARLQAFVSVEDYDFVRSIRPNSGTVNTTVALVFSKLVAALRRAGIDQNADKEAFESFVANCKIVSDR